MAITAIYNFRDLVADLSADAVGGNRTLGEFAATGALLASTSIPYLAGDKLGGYHGLMLGETAEAAGFSLSMAIGQAINLAIGGDSTAPETRLARVATGLAVALAMHAATKQLPVGKELKGFTKDYLKPVLGSAATGTVIVNTFELLSLVKDEVVKPLIVAPLLGKKSSTAAPTPSLRMRAQITRRGLPTAA